MPSTLISVRRTALASFIGLIVFSNSSLLAQVSVTALSPTVKDVNVTSQQPATAHAYTSATLGAKYAGFVASVAADIGDEVKAQSILLVIDAPELTEAVNSAKARRDLAAADLEAAKAGLHAAESQAQRIAALVKSKALNEKIGEENQAQLQVTKAEFAASDARLKLAEADLGEAQASLGYATLRAPFDGVVTVRNVDPGDLVPATRSSLGLLQVDQVDRLRIVTFVPERDTVYLDVGDEAQIVFAALPHPPFKGRVARIAGALDPQTRSMRTEIDLPNPGGRLAPGFFGSATITLEQRTNALLLPAGAVRFSESGSPSIYVLKADQTVEVRAVKLGYDDGSMIEIREGLSANERVVGASLERLTSGQAVTVRP